LNGVLASQVGFRRSGQTVTLVIAPTTAGGTNGGSVTLAESSNSDGNVETIMLADARWTLDQVHSRVLALAATSGNDSLKGFSGAETLIGGRGNDTLAGGEGSDTYIWNRGDGNDVVDEASHYTGIADTLVLNGVRAAQVSFARQGQTVTLEIAPSAAGRTDGGSVKLLNINPEQFGGGVETIRLSDSVWTVDQWRDKVIALAATSGDDSVAGFSGADTLIGGRGNDTLAGGQGNDVYRWSRGDGVDLIDEARYDSNSVDQLVLNGVSVSQVSLAPSGDDEMTLVIAPSSPGGNDGGGVRLRNLGPDSSYGYGRGRIETIVLADATWASAELHSRFLAAQATPGNDSIAGFAVDDTLTGGRGTDTLAGGDGNDFYIWNRGDGADLIDERGSGSADRLVLTGVITAQLGFIRSGQYAVTLTIAPSTTGGTDGGSVNLLNLNSRTYAGVETIVLADATWTKAQLAVNVLAAATTSGNDSIVGFSSGDTLVGGRGNDTLAGGENSDTYIWTRGDGDDLVDETSTDGGWNDTLVLNGVRAAQVSIAASGSDITLVIAPSANGGSDGGRITLLNIDFISNRRIESVILVDSVWGSDELRARFQSAFLAARATSGNDSIQGFDGSDTLAGGRGNDTLAGGAGNDTYIWNRGDGNDVIDESSYGGWADKLILNGVKASQVGFTRSGRELTLVIAPTTANGTDGGNIKLPNVGSDYTPGIESFVLADAVWSADDVRKKVSAQAAMVASAARSGDQSGADYLIGGSGSDSLDGGAGDDWLEGKAGDDWLTGGSGLDHFVIGREFGRDVITDFGTSAANRDILEVSRGVFADLQAFMAGARQVGSDVIVAATPNDVLTLKNVTLSSLDAADLRFVP
jgi:Ca2+-binding RTX toxin-like protein